MDMNNIIMLGHVISFVGSVIKRISYKELASCMTSMGLTSKVYLHGPVHVFIELFIR